jgi:hypothetical protein
VIEGREDADAVLAGVEVRRVRSEGHVRERRRAVAAFRLAHLLPVVALLGTVVLGVGRSGRHAVIDRDLHHLPVALVKADPGQALVVEVVEEPVLQPDAVVLALHVAAVHDVAIARPRLHTGGVLDVGATVGVQVIVERGLLRHVVAIRLAIQEREVKLRAHERRPGLSDQRAVLRLQIGGVPAFDDAVGHDRRRARPVGLMLVIGQRRCVLDEQPRAAGVVGGAHGRLVSG